ncbi:MAG: hypothetical protein AAFR61_19945 [Bacteroidota bacterium]
MDEKRFLFWIAYLKYVSLFFAVMGALWAIMGTFDPFGIYEGLMSEAFFDQEKLPPEAKKIFSFILGPFGATALGYFLLQYAITDFALIKRERWAYNSILLAFLAWFVLDSMMSIFADAFFNVLLANLTTLVLMAPAMVGLYPYIAQTANTERRRSQR